MTTVVCGLRDGERARVGMTGVLVVKLQHLQEKGQGLVVRRSPSWRWCARLFDRLLVTAMTSWGSAGSATVRHSLSRWLVDTMLYARDLDPHHLEQLGTA